MAFIGVDWVPSTWIWLMVKLSVPGSYGSPVKAELRIGKAAGLQF